MKLSASSLCLVTLAVFSAAIAFHACSSRSTPVSPVTPPTPGGGSTGTGERPVVLSQSGHPAGWGRATCFVCHQPGLIGYHHENLTEAQCLGCHGDNGTRPGYVRCVECHGNPPATGAHAVHIALTGFGFTCDTCHEGAGTAGAERHRDGIVEVSVDRRFGGSYAGSTCSNVFCHDGGRPNWRTDRNLRCIDCHIVGGTAAISPKSGKHSLHVAGAFLDCSVCHPAPPSTHFNAVLDNPGNIRPDRGSYSDSTPNGYNPNGSSGTCSGMTSPCHFGTAQWTTGESCGTCHNATNANPPISGSHLRHALSSRLNYPCNFCHALFPREHLNARVDVVFDSHALPMGGNYSGGTAGQCSQVYCHGGAPSDPVAGGSNTTPTWGNPATVFCRSCHGAPGGVNPYPTSGQHQYHIDFCGAVCSDCHNVWPQGHVDGVRTIVFDPAYPGAVFTRGAVPNTGSCSSVDCHPDPGSRSWG